MDDGQVDSTTTRPRPAPEGGNPGSRKANGNHHEVPFLTE